MTANEIKLDFARSARIGIEEAILCAGKSDAQLVTILEQIQAVTGRGLLTRLNAAQVAALPAALSAKLDYDPISRTGIYGAPQAPDAQATGSPSVAIVTAGSSDVPVAREARRTLDYQSIGVTEIVDVGVAGLWRLTERLDTLRAHPVVIVVAGMDGALPSVLGGLLPGVLIVVPTSTGYGMSRKGETALHAALASCAPGLMVVNIDNGFGAACAAARVIHAMRSAGAAHADRVTRG